MRIQRISQLIKTRVGVITVIHTGGAAISMHLRGQQEPALKNRGES
jgi:hypothetical protein